MLFFASTQNECYNSHRHTLKKKRSYYKNLILDTFIPFVHNKRSDDSLEDSSLPGTSGSTTSPLRMQEARKTAQVLGKACSLLLSHHLIQSWPCSSSVTHFKGSHLSSGWQLASHFCYALFKSSTVHGSPPKQDINGLRPSQSSS